MILKIKLLSFAGFCSLLFGYVINIDGVSFDEQDFYSKYSKSEWVKSSAGQKDRILKDYVKIGTGANVGGNLKKHIKALNKKMKESATNLEFEEAAKIRDEIRKLESTELEVTLNPKVKQYSLNNKIYPKGRSTMGMPGTRAQKGKKKWKQIKS